MPIAVQLTNNLGTFMEDLKDKAGVLNELGQGSNIYTALQGLATAYFVSRYSCSPIPVFRYS